jgi:hypothetical protein
MGTLSIAILAPFVFQGIPWARFLKGPMSFGNSLA